jgi:hypothetical protein
MRIIRAILVLAVIGPLFSHAGIVDAQTALAAKTQRKHRALYDLIAQIEAAANHLQAE